MRLLTTSLLAFSLLTGGSFTYSYAGEGKKKECACEKCEEGKCTHHKKGKKHECDCAKEGHSHEGHSHEGKKEEKKAE